MIKKKIINLFKEFGFVECNNKELPNFLLPCIELPILRTGNLVCYITTVDELFEGNKINEVTLKIFEGIGDTAGASYPFIQMKINLEESMFLLRKKLEYIKYDKKD